MTASTERQRRIVVGVDGSPQAKQALRWAARLGPALHAELDVVMVWDYPSMYGWSAIPLEVDLGQNAQKLVDDVVDEVFGADRPAGLRTVLRQGAAADVLLHEAHDALMLVVGSRGHGGFAGLLLGSVSAQVAEHAQCPVLVAHGSSLLADLIPA